MNDDPMLARLHEALDRGADPFDDVELVAWLDTRPEFLEHAARLRADARDLAHTRAEARPRSHGSRTWPRLLAAAALVAVGLGLQHLAATPPTSGPRIVSAQFEERRQPALAAATFRVHDARYQSSTASFESYTVHHERR